MSNGEPEIPPGNPTEVPPQKAPPDIPPGNPLETPELPPETTPSPPIEVPPPPPSGYQDLLTPVRTARPPSRVCFTLSASSRQDAGLHSLASAAPLQVPRS